MRIRRCFTAITSLASHQRALALNLGKVGGCSVKMAAINHSTVARAKQRMLKLAREANRGLNRNRSGEVLAAIAELEALCPRPIIGGGSTVMRLDTDESGDYLLSGTWELAWTTEKEVLFCLEKGLCGDGPCVGVFQTIDVARRRLENRVDFARGGRLAVQSSLTPTAEGFSFQFGACVLSWRGVLEVPLPPVGAGHAAVTFLDRDVRVQRDSRGDVLVCVRC